jgi:serine/threonine protein phosphatase PrpC
MQFKLLDSLSLPGDAEKPNEDSFAATAQMAAVFDGATGLGEQLMPGASDAAWLAQFAARRLRAHADAGDGNPRDWLRAAAGDAQKSFAALRRRPPQEQYELPFASLMCAALDGDRLNLLWFGDCSALFRTKGTPFALFGDAFERRGSERARVTKLVQPGGPGPAAPGVRDEFLPALRESRNRVNAGSEWLFAPDAACAEHAKEAQVGVEAGARILLASDGFLALASDYEAYTAETLFNAACTRGLAPLGQELRNLEAADPDGARFPRFKRSDDATALLLRVE